jgi:hypothetical protein
MITAARPLRFLGSCFFVVLLADLDADLGADLGADFDDCAEFCFVDFSVDFAVSVFDVLLPISFMPFTCFIFYFL